MKKKILAVIGLRSGSKGLKNKNIKKLNGKPLFYYILKSAKKSKLINKIIISTDSNKYKKMVQKYGGECPYTRPKKYSSDTSQEIFFIKDLLNKLEKNDNYIPDIVVRLLATCPFQKPADIDKSINLVLKKKYDSAAVISKAKQHPEKALKMIGKKTKYLSSYIDTDPLKVGSMLNRQQFKQAYFRANVLVCKKKIIDKYNSLSSKKPGFVIVPYQVDIDDLEDFKFSEFKIKNSS